MSKNLDFSEQFPPGRNVLNASKALIYFQLNCNLLGCKGCGTSAEYYRKCQLFIGLLRTRHFCCFIESVWCVRVHVCACVWRPCPGLCVKTLAPIGYHET